MTDDVQQLPRVAVIGAGLMGHGIAQQFMLAGSAVSIWDADPAQRDSVPDRVASHLAQLGIDCAVDIECAPDLPSAVRHADLVVEAIPEVMALKQDLLHQVETLAPHAIFASNTSVLRISEIAANAQRPDRVVGTHWWNPPYLIALVEVVRGEQTSDETVAQVTAWLEAAGKRPVEVHKDAPGFVGNRLQFALVREAAHIVSEGIADAETVDLVVQETVGKRWGAVGPLRSADFIGLDLVLNILDYLAPSLADGKTGPELFRRLVAEGKSGAKSGQGIYPWPEGERDRTEHQLVEHLLRANHPDPRTDEHSPSPSA